MKATYPLLLVDSSLMCVSAWNDNGMKSLIDTTRNGIMQPFKVFSPHCYVIPLDLLYRSDFFPGLGWMLTSDLWHELKPKWPSRLYNSFSVIDEICLVFGMTG